MGKAESYALERRDGTVVSSQVRYRFQAVTAIAYVLSFVAGFGAFMLLLVDRKFSPAVGVCAAIAVALSLFAAGLAKLLQRGGDRHRRIARQIYELASVRGWSVEKRMRDWETGWVTAPLANLKNVTVSPGALGASGSVLVGVAYLEGDSAVASAEVRTFSTRLAIAEIGETLPSMTLVSQGLKEEFLKLLGGGDLTVESEDFNRAWRVKTDDDRGAHGAFTPRVIEYLIGAAQRGVAIQFDGSRIVMWDDGTNAKTDLGARVQFLEGLIERLPRFLKPREQSASVN